MSDLDMHVKDDPSHVVTRSWWRMYWLTRILGYRVRMARHAPVRIRLGKMQYLSEWVLEKPPGNEPD